MIALNNILTKVLVGAWLIALLYFIDDCIDYMNNGMRLYDSL